MVGGATDPASLTDGNIGVVADGSDTLAVKLNKDIDLGADGSVAIGNTTVDNDGLAIDDGAGNSTTTTLAGTTVANDAGETTTVGAGTVAVTDGSGTTTIGGSEVSIGGSNPIVISGDAGTIGGLTNTTFDPDNYTSGQAATEDQLKQVSDVANAGWDVSAQGANATNVGVNSETGNSVDLNNADGNIVVSKAADSNDVTFDLAEDIDLGAGGSVTIGNTVVEDNSVTVGDTVITNNDVTTNELHAGDDFHVDGSGAHYDGPITDGDHIVNKDYVDGAVGDLGDTPLTFAGDTGTSVERKLGETVNVVGGATDPASLTDGNIGVVADGSDTLAVKLNKDIDLGADGSVAIGNTTVDNDGLAIDDGAGNSTTTTLAGTTVANDAGETTTVGAGTVAVTDGSGTTTIGGSEVSIGGSNPIVISGDAGTIGGLTNTTFDPDSYTSGQAATEDQLKQVSDIANAGWNVSAEGEGALADGSNNVAPSGTVDFSNNDGNVVIERDGTNLTFDLAEDIDLGAGGSVTIGNTVIEDNSITVGDTLITNNDVTTNELHAGDDFHVDGSGAHYDGPITDGDHIVNKDYVDGAVGDLGDTPLTFAGDTGTSVERKLGETVNVVGGATDPAALTDGNIGVVADGADTLTVKLNKDIDLGDDGSVTTGDTRVNNDGVVVDDGTGSTAIGAGTVAVTDGTGTTTINGSQVAVGGTNGITLDGDAGTIGGLTNTTFDPDNYTSGQAATEDQLKQVSDAANAGWQVADADGNNANIGPNGKVTFEGDGNISVAQTGADQDGVVEVALNRDLDLDSVTVGDTIIDTSGVAIGTDVYLGDTGLVINGGPSVTTGGINAGGLVISDVAPGSISGTSTDAVNGSQLYGMGDSITSIIGGNAVLNPDGTITASDIGGTGYDTIDEAIRAANDAANAGWTATDGDGNAANIGPDGTVTFSGDDNIHVAQTGEDNNGKIEVTLDRDLDVDSITAGNTVVDGTGVQVGDDVHLGDTGLVIDGGPSVTGDGIDAGGKVISNVADGVADGDAVNVGQLNEVTQTIINVDGRVSDLEDGVQGLENGASGPFQVSQDADFVPPAATGSNSAAGGNGAVASGANSTAVGNQSVASGADSTAVGQGAQATHDNSVALGQGSATTRGAQANYEAAYVGNSTSEGEVNVGNRTITGVAPGVEGTDAANVNQLNAGVNHAIVTANEYTDGKFNQLQGDMWDLRGRVDDLEKDINSGIATAMSMRQAPYVAGATTYYAGFGAYKGEGAVGLSLRRTSDNGRWSLEGGFSHNREGSGGYIGISGVLGGK